MDGAIASGLYWVATGRLPIEDLEEQKKKTDPARKPSQLREKGNK